MATHINGKNLEDKSFWPVYERCEALGLPIGLHPVAPVGRERTGNYHLGNFLGNPYEAGIAAGDELVAISDAKADEETLKRIDREARPGARVDVVLFRRKRLLSVPLRLGGKRAFVYEIVPDGKARPPARRLCRGWLGHAPGA